MKQPQHRNLSPLESIEQLLNQVRAYQKPNVFEELLKFCAKIRNLSPYNAWLINQQMPGAKAVMTAEQWKRKYKRKPKPNARPLVILLPFGPIGLVWDIQDTMPETGYSLFDDTQYILDTIASPFQVAGHVNNDVIANLKKALNFNGIVVEEFRATATQAGKIVCDNSKRISIETKHRLIQTSSLFLLSVNSNARIEEWFSTVCHELAHLFCHHITLKCKGCSKEKEWKTRNLSTIAEEFEAETVAWLVCNRLNLEPPSIDYLQCYIKDEELRFYKHRCCS